MPHGEHTHDHHDDHPTGHGDQPPRRTAGSLWMRLRLLTPHSHDSVDTPLETSKRGMRTLAWSYVTGSVALLGDTIQRWVDRVSGTSSRPVPLLTRYLSTGFTVGLCTRHRWPGGPG